jgi:hypothetical protein
MIHIEQINMHKEPVPPLHMIPVNINLTEAEKFKKACFGPGWMGEILLTNSEDYYLMNVSHECYINGQRNMDPEKTYWSICPIIEERKYSINQDDPFEGSFEAALREIFVRANLKEQLKSNN